MEKSFPLNDTPYLAEDLRMWFAGRTSGVLSTMDCLNISTVGGMVVRLGRGVAFLQAGTSGLGGTMYCNDGDLDFELDVADSILNRIDAIIIRYNVTSNSIKAMVLKGMPASEPKIPTLVRNSICYDIMLYTITVEAGYSSVEHFMINDERMNNEVCGLIRDNIERIPTEVLEATFLSWFEHVKDELSEDAAGHLQNQIDLMKTTNISKKFATPNEVFAIIDKGFGGTEINFRNGFDIPIIKGEFGDINPGLFSIYASPAILDGTVTIGSTVGLLLDTPKLLTTSDELRLGSNPGVDTQETTFHSFFKNDLDATSLTAGIADFEKILNSMKICVDHVETPKDLNVGGKLGGTAICAGAVNITPVPNVPTKVTVKFPVQLSGTPIGVASASSTVPGTGITGVSVAEVTRTKMDIYVTRTNNTLTYIHWIALAS